jgi:hypothetical protein
LVTLALALCLLASCGDEARSCGDPSGFYSVDFGQANIICDEDDVPTTVVVEKGSGVEPAVLDHGCTLEFQMFACAGGPGWCGRLEQVADGVYEGALTFAREDSTTCLIRTEHARLTRGAEQDAGPE